MSHQNPGLTPVTALDNRSGAKFSRQFHAWLC
jgi:hypothetical protein